MDCEKLDAVMKKYRSTVYGIALTHTRTKYDADDVYQDVFFTYWRKNKSFKDDEHEKAWLIRTALNLSKKAYNASLWRRSDSWDDSAEEAFVFEDSRENEVFLALKKLSPKLSSVVYLYYFEDMSVKDISRLICVREGTVRMRLTRARDTLRDILSGKEN